MNRSMYNTGVGVNLSNATAPTGVSLGLYAMADRVNFDKLASVPSGYPASIAIVPPMFAGGMSSYRYGVVTVEGAATGAEGLNGAATATVSVVGSAIGGLIAGGTAAGAITIDGTVVMFAALAGAGTALVTVGGTATASAIGHMLASGEITVDGTAIPYGIGWMDGTSDFGNELSPTSLANAVWQRAIEAGLNAEQILRLIAAATQGSAAGLESGAPVFKSIDGTTNRIVATYSSGTRTVTDRDAD